MRAPADPSVGGKARALAQAAAAGLPVPDWFVVLPDEEIDDVALAERAAKLAASVAVRSSAAGEDGADHSFAGQLDSFLFVAPRDVPDTVRQVRASGESERVLAYRRARGLDGAAPTPAVIVQAMVDAKAAGVAFGADPVTGDEDAAVVAAVRGVGEKLVSGEDEGETWRIDRDAVRERPASPVALDDARALDVARLARRCGEVFGAPQDIEWAWDGRLWLLQSRPITTLPRGEFNLWDNSNIAESYAGVTTPLTFSFIRHAYEEVYREFTRLLQVPPDAVARYDTVFSRMLGFVEGRVYYNLVSWYRVLALLPGFSTNRRFMEGMMGVREELPQALLRELRETASRHGFRHKARTYLGLAKEHALLERRIRAFQARLDAALRDEPEWEAMSAEALVAHYRDLERSLLKRWDAPLSNDLFAMIHYGLLKDLATRWLADADGTLQNGLLVGEGGMLSAEPAVRLREMAAVAREDPGLARALGEGSPADTAAAIAKNARFRELHDAYLARFADRCIEELKLETDTLRDDPTRLHRSIAQLAAREPSPVSDGASVRADAEALAARALRGHPLRAFVFRRVLRHARARVRDRENLRFERTRVFGRVRRVFVELGARLHDAGALDDARDVFYLEVDEVLSWVDGTGTTRELRALAAARKAENVAFRAAPAPPSRFSTRGPPTSAALVASAHAPPPADDGADERRGVGCCPGVVRGRARVVRDPRGARLDQGDILVAERTDPGWVLLFPLASGLVVEHGSLLSHAAIVAREMGIPAVVSCSGAMTWLKDGDEVELDGRTGRVRRLG